MTSILACLRLRTSLTRMDIMLVAISSKDSIRRNRHLRLLLRRHHRHNSLLAHHSQARQCTNFMTRIRFIPPTSHRPHHHQPNARSRSMTIHSLHCQPRRRHPNCRCDSCVLARAIRSRDNADTKPHCNGDTKMASIPSSKRRIRNLKPSKSTIRISTTCVHVAVLRSFTSCHHAPIWQHCARLALVWTCCCTITPWSPNSNGSASNATIWHGQSRSSTWKACGCVTLSASAWNT
mmetsp:Transcript_1140/g.2689  ORF Transcript_1140/g.2689 Transcript_1140/m.2689 type:complete len:235 (-) Transcript_1140:511-1215(-)